MNGSDLSVQWPVEFLAVDVVETEKEKTHSGCLRDSHQISSSLNVRGGETEIAIGLLPRSVPPIRASVFSSHVICRCRTGIAEGCCKNREVEAAAGLTYTFVLTVCR